MKILFLTILTIGINLGVLAQAIPADQIIGTWESIGSDVQLKFEIFKSGGTYSGKLLWASNMYEKNGKTPKKDFNNPDKNLQNRSRKGIVNIPHLKYENGTYTGGQLYNPDDGDTYSLKAQLKSVDKLEFRGYIGVSLLGKTMKFKRVE